MARAERAGTAYAKTTRPTIGTIVERAALCARLDEPAGRAVAWISGPPGAGKTTLAASYVQAQRGASVWYQVDADDADAASFFHYLTHAARKLGERAPDLPAFTRQHGGDVAAFARRFFRSLFAASAPLAVVIDNLNAVPAECGLHIALEAGFSQVPKGSCFIVTSRSEPPASLARLRVAGQMTCITGKDLSLTPDEILRIARLRGQALSAESAAKLHERTQGWAAGLTLLLEYAKFSGRIAEVPTDTTPQLIFDYLAGEIFERFEPRTREFLLRIACLPRMTGAMAAALGGEPRAERLLVNLARNDYFVRDVASDAGPVYQLHPLLREFLRARAAQALPEAVSRDWLERAAGVASEAGHVEDAVALLGEAENWDGLARIVVAESDEILAQGRSDTLAGWLDLLPPALLDASPRLLCVSAAARAHASPHAARRLFERAFDGFRAQDDVAGMTEACTGIVATMLFEFDDVTPLDRWLAVLDELRADSRCPTARSHAAIPALVFGTLLRDPGNARVGTLLDGVAGRLGADAVAILAVAAALARGDLVAAEAALGNRRADQAFPRFALAVGEGLLGLVAGRHDDAVRVAEGALGAAAAEGVHAYDAWLRCIVAAAKLCRADCAGARDALAQLQASGLPLRRGDRACAHYLRAWMMAIEGDVADAHREAKTALAVAVETGIPWFECLARIAAAQMQGGGADRRGVGAQLRTAGAIAERVRSPWLAYAVGLANANAQRSAGEPRAALAPLGASLQLGREHGFRAPLGWTPQSLGELCARALGADVEPELARKLVRDGRLAPATPPLRVRGWPWPFRLVTLGGFRCLRGESAVELSGKGPGRPMELLKVLVALGRHDVRADQLADALWPNAEADYAYKSFTATLHRLRRALDEDDVLLLRDGRLSLNRTLVWIDTWAFDQLCDDFDAALRGADACRDEALRLAFVADALELYRGPFLPDDSEQPSYIGCREQLRARLLRLLARVARGWEEAGHPARAADCWLRFIEVDEVSEPLHRQLILCLKRSGATGEAAAAYERLRSVLAARSKTMPSAELQALYASLGAGAAPAPR